MSLLYDQKSILPSNSIKYAGTYSIIAIDKDNEQIGAAVQSHWFAVGSLIIWAKAGVGAVATQSIIEPKYGVSGLALIRDGQRASNTLDILLNDDYLKNFRQVAMIDCFGDVKAYTGNRCIMEAGHITGKNYSVQANMVKNSDVWSEMEKKFTESSGDLAERMLCALEAAESAGGDLRGSQSAALVVVNLKKTGKIALDRIFDLRIDDHLEPIKEMRRLLKIARAYKRMEIGDGYFVKGEFEKAAKSYGRATEISPEKIEPKFWYALALAASGEMDKAIPKLSFVFGKEPKWRQMLMNISKNEIIPMGKSIMRNIIEKME